MIYDWLSWNSEIFEVSIEMSLHLNEHLLKSNAH